MDRYVVLDYLAEGGMGAIYLGKKMGAGGFEKQVVLKQLLPEFTQQPEFIDLFLREARLSATLDHANIIHTIDLVTAGDEHFIVMEYLDGADLRSILKKSKFRGTRLSPSAGIYIARELLSALAYAHNKHGTDGKHLRLIHRDISPSNILISRNGEIKLTDFGIAKAATHNSVFYRVKGKVGYMSPEQARSESMDARSDLYSMAVCLYEMITAERLLVAAGISTSADELYNNPIPQLSRKVSGLPEALDMVMSKALAIDPNERYQTAAEFQEALLRCAHKQGLMMSAPELATHLQSICGDPDLWREEDVEPAPNLGTELYDHEEGTPQLQSIIQQPGFDGLLSAGDEAVVWDDERRGGRAKTSLSLLGDLKGIELTSMAALAGSVEGAQPLFDLDGFGYDRGHDNLKDSPPVGEPLGKTRDELPSARRAATVPQSADDYTGVIIVPGRSQAEEPKRGRLETVQEARKEEQVHWSSNPWLMLALVLLLGVGTAAIVGLTGAQLEMSEPSGNEAAL